MDSDYVVLFLSRIAYLNDKKGSNRSQFVITKIASNPKGALHFVAFGHHPLKRCNDVYMDC